MNSMKMNISSALIVFVVLVFSILPVNAKEVPLTGVTFKFWKQGTSVAVSKKNYELSTMGLTDGYYTTTLANEKVRDFTDVAGMKIELKVGDADVRVNLVIGTTTPIRFEDGSTLLALDETTGEIHRLTASFGTFTLPANFVGILVFLFDQLESSVGRINYWGLTVVQEEETVVEFSVEGVSTLDDKGYDAYQNYVNDVFEAPATIQIPVVGESIGILKGPTEGVYILASQNQSVSIQGNILTVTTKATEGQVDYRFVYDNGKYIRFSTNLIQSWIVGVEDQGIPIALPTKGFNLIERWGILLDRRFLFDLRLGIGILAILFLIFYRVIRRKGGN